MLRTDHSMTFHLLPMPSIDGGTGKRRGDRGLHQIFPSPTSYRYLALNNGCNLASRGVHWTPYLLQRYFVVLLVECRLVSGLERRPICPPECQSLHCQFGPHYRTWP